MKMDTAVILAGGKSSRMGFDKRLIKINGRLIIKHQLESLKDLFDEIIIVTNNSEQYKEYGCRVVADDIPNFGPLGGIHAALGISNSAFNYFIACDMPFINKEYILYMRNKLKVAGTNTQAAVTRLGDWIEPFNAYYSKDFIPIIEQAYQEGQNQISKVLDKAQVIYISENEARSFSPDWDMFININTKRDLDLLNKQCKANGKTMSINI